jgi:hypothetical protein
MDKDKEDIRRGITIGQTKEMGKEYGRKEINVKSDKAKEERGRMTTEQAQERNERQRSKGDKGPEGTAIRNLDTKITPRCISTYHLQ